MNKPYEGIFITLEGGEGAGKTTLATQLAAEFTSLGYEVVQTREPGGSSFSEKIRALLLDQDPTMPIMEKTELLLFLAARMQNIQEVILPALHQKKIVICDRFNDSTIAYQGFARHLGSDFVENLCHLVCQIQPDLTFLLDLDPEIGIERIQKQRKETLDRVEKEKLQFHKEVRQGFLHLADKYPKRIKILDGALSKEEVFKQAMYHFQVIHRQ